MKQVRRNESDIHITAKSFQELLGTTEDICGRDAQLQGRTGDLCCATRSMKIRWGANPPALMGHLLIAQFCSMRLPWRCEACT